MKVGDGECRRSYCRCYKGEGLSIGNRGNTFTYIGPPSVNVLGEIFISLNFDSGDLRDRDGIQQTIFLRSLHDITHDITSKCIQYDLGLQKC